VSSGTDNWLTAIWGFGPADIWAVGWDSTLAPVRIHWDGSSWTGSGPPARHLYDVWGAAPDDVYTVDVDGTIEHWDGTSWTDGGSPTANPLWGLWGTGSDLWAVGGFGTILRR
jgi:hypothetical protein